MTVDAKRKPGDKMPDGTVYAGVSPDTGDAMFVTPSDATNTMKFNEAAGYTATLDAHAHADWRLPTKAELSEIYKNRHEGALKGTFNETSGPGFGHWYWSHTGDHDDPTGVYFVDFTAGAIGFGLKNYNALSARPLRTEPRP